MIEDPYILENDTLRNKLNITDYEELKKAECDIGFVKLMSLDDVDTKCDGATLFRRIHKHIFEDIFDWAGEYRTIPIEKQEQVVIPGISLVYGEPNNIAKDVDRSMQEMYADKWNPNELDGFAKNLTGHLAKIWRIHPFRDGNTRTSLAFAYLFSKQHGVDLEIGKILQDLSRKKDPETGRIRGYSIRDRFLLAALDEEYYPEPQQLENLLKSVLEKQKDEIER